MECMLHKDPRQFSSWKEHELDKSGEFAESSGSGEFAGSGESGEFPESLGELDLAQYREKHNF